MGGGSATRAQGPFAMCSLLQPILRLNALTLSLRRPSRTVAAAAFCSTTAPALLVEEGGGSTLVFVGGSGSREIVRHAPSLWNSNFLDFPFVPFISKLYFLETHYFGIPQFPFSLAMRNALFQDCKQPKPLGLPRNSLPNQTPSLCSLHLYYPRLSCQSKQRSSSCQFLLSFTTETHMGSLGGGSWQSTPKWPRPIFFFIIFFIF